MLLTCRYFLYEKYLHINFNMWLMLNAPLKVMSSEMTIDKFKTIKTTIENYNEKEYNLNSKIISLRKNITD